MSTLLVSGNTMYVGGAFTNIGGQTRNRIAALDITINTNNATAWNPNAAGGIVNTIAVSGNTIYVGAFTNIGGQRRSRLASFDALTGNLSTWDPGVLDIINTINVSGNTVYTGGDFGTIGLINRNGIAALRISTGELLDWNPDANSGSVVHTIAVSGNTIYVGGHLQT